MKKISTLVLVVFALSMLLIEGCKKSNDPEPETARVEGLLKSGTWKVSTVTITGTDQTSLFNNMTLKFTPTNYTTTNGGVVWPPSGTWNFTNDTASIIKRDDGVEIALSDVSETSFKLTFPWNKNTFGTGRVSSVAGTHVFTMVKQ